MSVGSIGESRSSTRTQTIDQTIDASENAVVQANRHSNNARIVVKPGATYSVGNGVSAAQLQSILAGLLPAATTGAPTTGAPTTGTGGVGNINAGIDAALAARVGNQITAGGEAAVADIKGTLPKSSWILLAIGAALLIAAVAFKFRHK